MLKHAGKNGIEIEMFARDNESYYRCYDTATSLLRHVSSRVYHDDGKPEYPSRPWASLAGLVDDLHSTFSAFYERCQENNMKLYMVGTCPMDTTSRKFASGHVHQSVHEIPSSDDVLALRRKMFSMQPFIAMLGQNSPIMQGVSIGRYRDTRLKFSQWCILTEANSPAGPSDHYLALAWGRDQATLEIRIPSSASLHQLIATTAIIKSTSFLDRTDVVPLEICREAYENVLEWGARALVPVYIPRGISFLGSTPRKVYLPISQLFKLYISRGETAEALDEVLNELGNMRASIEEIIHMFCDGFTFSDLYLNLWNTLGEENKKKRYIDKLEMICRRSYVSLISPLRYLSRPSSLPFPVSDDEITIDDLQRAIKEIESSFTSTLEEEEVDHILFTSIHSLKRSKEARMAIKKIASAGTLRIDDLPLSVDTLDFLFAEGVIKETSSGISMGDKFDIVYQLARRYDLI